MPLFTADLCKMCETRTPPERTKMFKAHPGAFCVCPKCDRLPCRKCEVPILDGRAKICPKCQWPVGKKHEAA